MTSRWGVRGRVTLTTAVLTTVAMVWMLVIVWFAMNRVTDSRAEASLQDRITSVESSLQVRDGGLVAPRTGADEVLDTVWIFDDTGTEVSGPEAGERVEAEVRRLSDSAGASTVKRGERLFVVRPVSVPSDPSVTGVAVATESTDAYERTRDVLLVILLLMGVVVVAGTAGLTAWTVGRTLRPVSDMTEAADEWSSSDLDRRFEMTGTDEFARLGRTFDGLLDRVAHAIRTEQQLTGELAHELRTPLTAIRGEAELALLARPDDATAERFTRIVEQVDRLSTTITTLLDLARHAPDGGRRSDVGQVVGSLVGPVPSGLEVTVDATPGVEVGAAPELLERALAPLIDNAIRHAVSRVSVVVRRDGVRALVSVSDDGPGIDEADLDELFRAGFSRSDADGAGLGLALSSRVAGTMGGQVRVASLRGPTTFELSLPTG